MPCLQLPDEKTVVTSRIIMMFEERLLHSQRQWMTKTKPAWRNSGNISTSITPQTSQPVPRLRSLNQYEWNMKRLLCKCVYKFQSYELGKEIRKTAKAGWY
jgi:hypothetical protein